MDINKLIPDEEVELTEILAEKEAALSSDPNEVPEYRYSKVEDKLAKLANEDMGASASAMKAELFKDALSGGGSGGGGASTATVTFVSNNSSSIPLQAMPQIGEGDDKFTVTPLTIPRNGTVSIKVPLYKGECGLLTTQFMTVGATISSVSGNITYDSSIYMLTITGDGTVTLS